MAHTSSISSQIFIEYLPSCNFLFAPNAIQFWRGLSALGSWDNRHMKVIRLSGLRTGLHYALGDTLGTHFSYRLGQPHSHRSAGSFKSMKNPDPSRIKPATFLTLVQCFNQLYHCVPPERIVAIPNTRVSKTLLWGTVNYSRIFAFSCKGSRINFCKKRGMSVYIWCYSLITRRSIRTWNFQNGKAYFSGIASKAETSKSEAAPVPLLQNTELSLRVQCSCHY